MSTLLNDYQSLKLYLYWSGVVLFLFLELPFSYRIPTVSKTKRWIANLPLSVVNGLIYHWIYFGVIISLLSNNDTAQTGFLNYLGFPFWLKTVLGVLVLDFFIYVWHLLNHEMPLLWRFHRVHHADMNMDVSTANRFHLGEILVSGIVRLLVIYAFGIGYFAYFLFEVLLNIAIQFHHSSIQIHPGFEKIWMLLFVPPSMHRIHHSVKIRERDSNYGVLFSLWDRIFGTFTPKADQENIIIGIGSHRDFSKLGFFHMMIFPFTKKSI